MFWAWRYYYLDIIYNGYIYIYYIYIHYIRIMVQQYGPWLVNKSNISSKPVTYLPPTWGSCDSLQTSLKCFVGGAIYPPLTAEDMLGVIFRLYVYTVIIIWIYIYKYIYLHYFICSILWIWLSWKQPSRPFCWTTLLTVGLLRPFFRKSTSYSRSRALRSHVGLAPWCVDRRK